MLAGGHSARGPVNVKRAEARTATQRRLAQARIDTIGGG